MKKANCKIANVDEYIKRKIWQEVYLKQLRVLTENTEDGFIGGKFFDKIKFDNDIKNEIKKRNGITVDLKPYWDSFLKESSLYMQVGFLKKTYGYTFRRFGIFKDYGAIIFYAKRISDKHNAVKDLIANWFYSVVLEGYGKEVSKQYVWKPFKPKNFEYCIRWRPIAEAAMHFDKTLCMDDIKSMIIGLAYKEELYIKMMDEYEIAFC